MFSERRPGGVAVGASPELPWILNLDLELRIHRSLALYVPRKSEQWLHRGLILRLARRAADAQRPPKLPGSQRAAAGVGRPPGGRRSAFVLEEAEEQALVIRAFRSDPQAKGDPVVAEFLARWGVGPEG